MGLDRQPDVIGGVVVVVVVVVLVVLVGNGVVGCGVVGRGVGAGTGVNGRVVVGVVERAVCLALCASARSQIASGENTGAVVTVVVDVTGARSSSWQSSPVGERPRSPGPGWPPPPGGRVP